MSARLATSWASVGDHDAKHKEGEHRHLSRHSRATSRLLLEGVEQIRRPVIELHGESGDLQPGGGNQQQ